jgi:Ca2+-binding EF-hand superfamily protein
MKMSKFNDEIMSYLKKEFRNLDRKNVGYIQVSELENILEHEEKTMTINEKNEIKTLISMMDKDKNKKIEFDEFVAIFEELNSRKETN